MTEIFLLLLTAAVAFGLSKLFRIPAIPLLVLGGIALRQIAERQNVVVPEALLNEMIEIGLAVLVFTVGVDLSPRRMRGRSRPIVTVAVIQFLTLGGVGFLSAALLGYDLTTALYLGCALSASSTLVVVRHLQQRRQMFEPYGRLVLGVLLLQDVFIIVLMVLLLKAPEGMHEMIQGIIKVSALGALAAAAHKWVIPWVAKSMNLDDEELLLGALAMLFVFSGLAYFMELPFLVGAFLAGFSLSAFPMNGLVRGILGSLSAFFLSLFFISIGAILVFPGYTMLGHGIIFILVLILVTVILVSIVAEAVGYSTRASIEAGLLLSQMSEFSLLIALTGVVSGQISDEFFSLIGLATVGSMTLTPLIARDRVAWGLMKLHPRYSLGEPSISDMKDHAVILGYGRAGPRTLKFLMGHGIPVVVVDDDAAVIRRLIDQGVTCIQGDGADTRILERVNARQARVVLCSMRRTSDARVALQLLKGSPAKVIARTFEDSETRIVLSAGGIPVPSADASVVQFLKWMETNL